MTNTTEETKIVAFKGFDKNLSCRGYPFEVGQTYEHQGKVAACSSGFHACENPWDVLSYYPLVGDEGALNRFARVTLGGELSRHDTDSKIASARITIDAELKLSDFVIAGVNWLIEATNVVVSAKAYGLLTDKGEDGAHIGSSGDGARIGSSGNYARIGSSGYGARIGSSGYGAHIGSSGYGAQIGSSGDGAQIGSSGDGARIGSSGNYARIGSSGDGARIGSSGNYAQIGSSGDGAQINSSGERAVIASAGPNTRVKGANGAWISVAEYVWNSRESRYDCVGFATGQVGVDGIPADTWLIAKGGKLVECGA